MRNEIYRHRIWEFYVVIGFDTKREREFYMSRGCEEERERERECERTAYVKTALKNEN